MFMGAGEFAQLGREARRARDSDVAIINRADKTRRSDLRNSICMSVCVLPSDIILPKNQILIRIPGGEAFLRWVSESRSARRITDVLRDKVRSYPLSDYCISVVHDVISKGRA